MNESAVMHGCGLPITQLLAENLSLVGRRFNGLNKEFQGVL